ncbi:DUF4180 domain-containing protein [Actinocorallia sp. API 0066]|uniref:DUF4180 domain-containing protein n=1 Tax=Actinocorallia sp. API 0066 TaxID=2896846 RepID=UPI001E3B5C36|nr:DUF4180 domain-containing protein [Actinocorallia sp. API 0066]MCD0449914.1 DUF4180 domain-containing protein [Actinocorallia sp. API 0066]
MSETAPPVAVDVHGTDVLFCPVEGAPFADVAEVIGDAWATGASWVVVPVGRLLPSFFDLATREAGEIVQKFVNYRLGLAVVGDLTPYLEASNALRAFVGEANRGAHTWFLPDEDAFRARLLPR